MYIEHPYFYEGKYYANIDGEMIEITKLILRNGQKGLYYTNFTPNTYQDVRRYKKIHRVMK